MDAFINLIFTLAFVGVFVAYWFWLKRSKKSRGSITTRGGITYPTIIGDDIAAEDRTFNGMQVTFKAELPHIYLDSHGDSLIRGPHFTYDNNQRLQLEGDFNKYFQLFAPKKFQDLVLSILTPDIMQTLIQTDEKYDIEIRGNKLNIINYHRVSNKPEKINELKEIALAVTEEIEHKLKSWTESDALEARRARLRYGTDEAVKVFGRYYSVVFAGTIACAGLALLLYLTSLLISEPYSTIKSLLQALAFVFFPFVPILIWRVKIDE